MKVAIVGDYPLNLKKISGGVSVVISNLVEGLRKLNGMEIHIITCKDQVKKSYTISEKPVEIHYFPEQKRFGNITSNVLDTWRIKRKIEEIKPQIIHCFEQSKYSYASLQTNFPTIMEITMLVSEEAKFSKGLIGRVRVNRIAFIERFCLKRAKDIIIISPYVKEKIREKTKASFHYRPNPIKNEYFMLENSEEEKVLLFAGRVVESKGIHILLQALTKVKSLIQDINLKIAGKIVNKVYFNFLTDYIEKNDLTENVQFLGLLSERQLLNEYAKCSIFVMPSFHETFCNTVAQSMAAGKPVVASRVGGVASYLKDGETGFIVEPGDAQKFGDKVIELLSNKDLRNNMGKKGREYASRFKIDNVARQNHRIYEIVVNKK